ncbi:hypothetical protein BDP27DRAFT_1433273 [Rhodocollybia butyracea]|uniref:Uncharacterized protein n=1 Tax=Rhodocollybia butyracea TaxID=206335 RepID=A0A9P5P3Q8_9AGAR|nr:hypothetical protein BDP27DRAFT_1433273 [Rhodocollybia butyracea]
MRSAALLLALLAFTLQAGSILAVSSMPERRKEVRRATEEWVGRSESSEVSNGANEAKRAIIEDQEVIIVSAFWGLGFLAFLTYAFPVELFTNAGGNKETRPVKVTKRYPGKAYVAIIPRSSGDISPAGRPVDAQAVLDPDEMLQQDPMLTVALQAEWQRIFDEFNARFTVAEFNPQLFTVAAAATVLF